MTTRLLVARVGAGKTNAVQDRLLELKRHKPLAKAWVLLSTERQILDFRQRFMNYGHVYFNIDYFNFYSLYHRLLATAGTPQRCLDDTARYALIRAMLGDLYAPGSGIFGGVAQTPGFVKIIAAFIYELKQNLIEPQDFERAASTPKELELAQIYVDYQLALIRSNLVDREGEGWLALERLRAAPEIVSDIDLLIVDGYDQFNRLQTTLLALLGAQTRETLITLTTVPGRAATIGRRFQDALDQLQSAFNAAQTPFEVITVSDPFDERQPALKHLSEQLLRPKPLQLPADGTVTLIEAPDPAREVGAVLRHIKRLLLDGCAPDDVLIALRDWGLYGGQITAQGQIYGLPLALHYGEPLAQNPAVVALLDLLNLHVSDFRRRDLFDVLRSPYFSVPGLDAEKVAVLERISLEMQVTGGQRAWLEAIELASAPETVAGENDTPPLLIDPEIAAWLWGALNLFFAQVTPPENLSVEGYVAWLENLIGQDTADPDEGEEAPPTEYSLAMPERIRAEDADPAIVARDLAAMQQVNGALRGLLSAQTLAESLGYTRVIDWKTFFRDLKTALDTAVVGRGTGRDGRVLVTTVTDARGLPHRHIFILGLSEGIFPQPAPEDPLLLDSERQHLGIGLLTQAERAGDDGLFYSLIGQAQTSLTLSRPHSKNGETWAESHLWRAARAVFTDLEPEHLKLGNVARDPATLHEAALAAAASLSKGEPAACGVDPAYWARIRQARAIELGRMSLQRHDHYSGRLHDAELIAWVANELNPRKLWSATQLNDYGLCGFRYFAGRMLQLEPLETPEAGMDNRQLGTLYHQILEETYRRLGGAVTPDRREEALALLNEVARRQMDSAPHDLRFRTSLQWEQEKLVLLRRLTRLIEDDFSTDSPLAKKFGDQPRAVYRQEAKFGGGWGTEVAIDLGANENLRVRGSIDRMDRQGDRVIVVDYKTGGTPIKAKEIEDGRNFQMMIYLLAAQALIEDDPSINAPRAVAGGLFWQIGRGEIGSLTAEDSAIINAGKAHLRRYLERARQGDFAASANHISEGKCAHYCDFHQFCRISITNRRKS